MFCKNCGKEIPDTAAHCPNCGAANEAAKAAEQSAKPAQNAAPNPSATVAAATASTSGVGGNAGTMSAADMEKLDGFETAGSADIQEIIDNIWPAA